MGPANLTPEFQKVLRGYKPDEVDEFIAQISTAYEQVRRESFAAKDEVEKLKKQLEYFLALENTLNKALVSAQQKADEIINTAQDEVNRSLAGSMERLENIDSEIAQILAGAAEKSRQIEEEANRRAEEILVAVREQVLSENAKQAQQKQRLEQTKQNFILFLKNTLGELEGTGSQGSSSVETEADWTEEVRRMGVSEAENQ